MTALTFQEIIMRLDAYWADQGCLSCSRTTSRSAPAPTHPATFLRVLGPEPWTSPTRAVPPPRRWPLRREPEPLCSTTSSTR